MLFRSNTNQFNNQLNLLSHYNGTGVEIIYHSEHHCFKPTALILGTGTGGTLMGAGKVLKEQFSQIQIVAVEPSESPVMSGGQSGLHGIQGIGDGSKFMVDLSFVDKIITVSTSDATDMMVRLSKEFGLFCGISSGANILASIQYCKETGFDNVVTILCDRGERYLSCF